MEKSRLWIYWFTAGVILVLWTAAMYRLQWWGMFSETWPLSLTMVFGSFIAGATAEGGGAVAFPVFTKAFGIPPHDAKIFAFMIQSFGMTMAGLFIYIRKIPVLWHIVGLCLAGGIAGLVTGDLLLVLPDPYPKLFFSLVAAVFGLFLIYNRWGLGSTPCESLPVHSAFRTALFLITGFVGGVISSVIGVGIDMTLFIVLTLLFGINEKVSTPTTVALMGLLSVAGFFWHGAVRPGIAPEVWQYWMSCVPIVIFGAPLGAWVCSRISRDHLLYLLLLLISVDLLSTIWVVPLNAERLLFLLFSGLIACVLFAALMSIRKYMK